MLTIGCEYDLACKQIAWVDAASGAYHGFLQK